MGDLLATEQMSYVVAGWSKQVKGPYMYVCSMDVVPSLTVQYLSCRNGPSRYLSRVAPSVVNSDKPV